MPSTVFKYSELSGLSLAGKRFFFVDVWLWELSSAEVDQGNAPLDLWDARIQGEDLKLLVTNSLPVLWMHGL